jgi:hypothetical protein
MNLTLSRCMKKKIQGLPAFLTRKKRGIFPPWCMRGGRKVNLFVCIPLTEKEVQLKRKGGGTGMVPYLESGALP